MILVDIYVPSVDKTYDFNLRDLMLCDRLNCRILPMEVVLKDCGIHNGSSLLLV